MFTTAGLLDVHERTHRSLGRLLDHLAGLPADDLQRELEGFSYPAIAMQVHHVLGAESYWMRVLAGGTLDLEDDASARRSVEALRTLRERVAAETVALLAALSDADVSAPRAVTTYDGRRIEVAPAHVLLRTQTHAYQHQGEVASMLRQLGHSFPPRLDFPL